jgi:hypothetical protein
MLVVFRVFLSSNAALSGSFIEESERATQLVQELERNQK